MESLDNQIVVSIQCLVYNHEPYLRQCLEGFVMQKTNFRFEAIVHDDASTDKSADIIREYAEKYPDIIKPIYEEENQYSKKQPGLIGRIMSAAMSPSSKYIAICEGDDYWIDPLKLQKQVDYMETHPECGLVYTNSRIFNQSTGMFSDVNFPKQTDFNGLLVESVIFTLTTCYKREFDLRYSQEIQVDPNWLMGDTPLWLFIAAQGPIKYLTDVTSVYRVLENSASHSNDINKTIRFCLSSYDIRIYFAKKYHCENLIKQITVHHINELFKIAVSFDKSVSFLVAKMAWRNFVFSPLIWLKTILYATSCGRELHRWRYTS